MSDISSIMARTTMLMTSNQLSGQLRQTQEEMFKTQRQISTGMRVENPSDAPGETSAIQFLRGQLQTRGLHQRNLEHAESMLNNIDSALKETNDVLLDAKNLALGQIGVGSDSETRKTTALTIDANIDALMDLGNRKFNNIALFGGADGAGSDAPVFEPFLGGVRYRGGEQPLRTTGGQGFEPAFNTTGHDALGALSARVVSPVEFRPQPTSETSIHHVAGVRGEGVSPGSVRVEVDGQSERVDLTDADNLGDVVTRVNAALDGLEPGAGALGLGGEGYELTANAGHQITIEDIGSGKTAADLGITLTASDDETVAGGALRPLLEPTTPLGDLDAQIDLDSGLHITQGGQTKVADFSEAETVQDMQNVIERLELGLRLQINEQRDGFNLVSEVSGVELAVGENGGTTARDLGLASLDANTLLSDFRHGRGVETHAGEPDVVFSLRDGTQFEVDLDGATTVGEVLGAIEAAAVDAGASVGAGEDLELGFADTGTGIAFTDNTAGGEQFRITNASQSRAATHLGIAGDADGGDTIIGQDNATVKVDGVFTHLIDLRDALRNDDERGITIAGERLDKSLEHVASAQAQIGVEAKRVQEERSRSEDQKLTEESMLSELRDASLPEVITRFTQLQTQMQASLQVGAQNMQLSLLDFLR